MDSRLEIKNPMRAVATDTAPNIPLVTVAWRALRSEHQKRSEERRRAEAELVALHDVIGMVAGEAYKLRCLALSGDPAMACLAATASRVEAELTRAGVGVVVPVNEPYSDAMMELFDNIAQRTDASIDAAHIAEVVEPAVIYKGGLLRRGKVVIAMPVRLDSIG